MTSNLKKKLEECPVCKAYHDAVKQAFCTLLRQINPNVQDCEKIFDEIMLEGKREKKRELAEKAGVPEEILDKLFEDSLRIANEALTRAQRGLVRKR